MGTDVNPKLKEMLKELHELAHQIQVRYPYNINLQRQVHFLVYKLDQTRSTGNRKSIDYDNWLAYCWSYTSPCLYSIRTKICFHLLCLGFILF